MATKQATAGQRLAEYMQKHGAGKWVSISTAFESIDEDPKAREAGFTVSEAREILRVGHGLTIMRKDGRLCLTQNAEETRDYEIEAMHQNLNRELALRSSHLEQTLPHHTSDEEAAKTHDAQAHIMRVKTAIANQRARDERKKLLAKRRQELG